MGLSSQISVNYAVAVGLRQVRNRKGKADSGIRRIHDPLSSLATESPAPRFMPEQTRLPAAIAWLFAFDFRR